MVHFGSGDTGDGLTPASVWLTVELEHLRMAAADPRSRLAGDRIGFSPIADDRYELHVPIGFDRVLSAGVPSLRGLQDRVTSPTGTDTSCNKEMLRIVRAA
jgi:hypothetical protein